MNVATPIPSRLLGVAPEVAAALEHGRPVVADYSFIFQIKTSGGGARRLGVEGVHYPFREEGPPPGAQ